MLEIKSFADLPLILTFFVPGVLLQKGRAIFHPSVAPKLDKDSVGGIVVISTVYAIVASIATGTSGSFLRTQPDFWAWVWLLLYSILAPFAIGLLIGFIERRELMLRLASRYRLPIASPLRSAWDAMASGVTRGTFVIVKVEGGHTISGMIGPQGRLAATGELDQPDIYIDEVYKIKAPSGYEPLKQKRGVWIPASQIIAIEVVHPVRSSVHDT